MKSNKQQAKAAAAFARRWQGRGYEKGDSQVFWTELLAEVFGIPNPSTFIRYEEQVKVDTTNFIDAHIPSTKVLIEQKSLGRNLREPIRQSGGIELTPFEQARRYVLGLPLSQHPRYIVTCNFAEFLVYDMEQPHAEPQQIFLKDLDKEYYRLRFLVESGAAHLQREMQVSMQAGEIVGKIYDELLRQYNDPSPQAQRWLNILCVRLVFCLYAEDAGIFSHDQFHDYLAHCNSEDLRAALLELFDVLNTPEAERTPYLKESLKAFPYTNGGLFGESIEVPQFTFSLRELLVEHASKGFDWSEISPTIFGAVFESTLNPDTRRKGGMHYTSIENIHKVIDPLFLNSLRAELDAILAERIEKRRVSLLTAYQEKLASLIFFDPACGSGNFLTETYLSLRRLENIAIRERFREQKVWGAGLNPIRVSIQQFHGIEINDFAVAVATTALWISENQMMAETERIVQQDLDFLPLKTYTNIHEGNALQMDWQSLIPEHNGQLYIIGNPPFIGANNMSPEQHRDLVNLFGPMWRNIGEMDYVTGWYKKASDFMKGSPIRAAFVSTNSICQGEQVPNLWAPLFADGLHIDFAHRTFRWDNEANNTAHVHCVIIGFSYAQITPSDKFIYDNGQKISVKNINAYLMDAPDIFIRSRKRPLEDIPPIRKGNQPTDGGNLIIDAAELEDFLRKEPKAKKFIKQLVGAKEYINNKPRYCLWLKDATPAELRAMPLVLQRMERVHAMRLASSDAATRRLADTPHLFRETNNPETFILIPSHSSENRPYIPMGFLGKDFVSTNATLIIPDATLYHFGVLMSSVHMAWMRAVCGRLKSDYRYSKDVVYNNFPWPEVSSEQTARIETTAQAILDARALYPDSTLADLYDPRTMPPELRRAHQQNDRSVLAAYGFPCNISESDIVTALFRRYQALISPATE